MPIPFSKLRRLSSSLIVLSACFGAMARAEPGVLAYPPGPPVQANEFNSCGMYLASVEGFPIGKGGVLKYPDGRILYEASWLYKQWAQGYLSALNIKSGRSLIALDYAAVEVWLRRYCNNHPTVSYIDAIIALVAFSEERK